MSGTHWLVTDGG